MHQPKISVCIPSYNYGKYISPAIDSVLNQTCADFELIVSDNASTDMTEEIMRRYEAQDTRIRYIRQETNHGMVANWNICLREARGKYIKFLFADDLIASRFMLEQMASVLDSDDSIALVGCARNFVNNETGTSKTVSFIERDSLFNGTDVINVCLKAQHNLIGEPTAVMFRKDLAAREFDGRYRQLVDLEMWFHLLEQGKYYHFAEPFCVFRIHDEQTTAINAKNCAVFDDLLLLYGEYLDKSYVAMSASFVMYLWHDYYYQIWKAYRKYHRIQFDEVASRVRRYGLMKLILLHPIYRIYKTFLKLARKSGGAAHIAETERVVTTHS